VLDVGGRVYEFLVVMPELFLARARSTTADQEDGGEKKGDGS
jgi:hypothetical protein